MPSFPISPALTGATLLAALMSLALLPLAAQPNDTQPKDTQPTDTQPPASSPTPDVAPAAEPTKPAEPPIQIGGEVELEMKDGRKVSGILVEQTSSRVIVAVGGLATPFDLAGIARIRAIPTVEERYDLLRRAIPDDDVDTLLQLAEWLRGKGRLGLALTEVDRALKADPDSQQARDLRVIIIEQSKLQTIRPAPREERFPVVRPARREFPLLDEAQINIMRVLEVDLKNPPRMNIRQETVRRFLDAYAGREAKDLGKVPVTPEGRDVFLRKPPAEILAWMFELRAREIYGEDQIMDDPKAMRLFRDSVHRNWLVNSCSTTRCHGGEEAGRLWLHNRQPNAAASVYTNFLIMDRFRLDDGRPLISYDSPADSILLEYGLPVKDAVRKHPEIQGMGKGRWQPVFSGRDDERYKAAIEWIRSMYRPRPEYPVDYTPPVPGGARDNPAEPRLAPPDADAPANADAPVANPVPNPEVAPVGSPR
jgi:hypothetical protein